MSAKASTIEFMKQQLIKLLTVLLKEGNYGTLTIIIEDGVATKPSFKKTYKLELL